MANPNNRRDFLSLTLAAGLAGGLTPSASAQVTNQAAPVPQRIYPASTAVGTPELAIPGLEIEIEAIAVI